MSGEEPTTSRVRRMLPSVSEVLKELTARAPIEPEIAFRAAREVCAEELKRLRDAGGDGVPLEDLVQKAFLRATGAGLSVSPLAPALPVPLTTFVSPRSVQAPRISFPTPAVGAEAPAMGVSQEVEDPFSETTGAMDLRWDRGGDADVTGSTGEAPEPFSALPGNEDAHSGSGLVEEPEPAVEAPVVPFLFEAATDRESSPTVPTPFVLPADEGTEFSEPEPQAVPGSEIEVGEGPGNETLSRLSREAKSIDLEAVFPKAAAPAVVPFAITPQDREEPRVGNREPESELVPFEDDEDTVLTIPRGGRSGRAGGEGGPRIGFLLGTVAGLVALAGLGYLLVGLWVERSATPISVAVSRPRPAASPTFATPVPAASRAAVPALETAEVPAPASTPVVEGVLPPALGDAAPTPTARPVPSPSPVLAPAPVPVSIAPNPPVPAAVPVRQSRDGLIVTKDRAGQAQVFSIHFTSYKDRASAERDLKRVQGLAGREGYVAEVDLGEKGVWFRVMVGAFGTAQEAKAVRGELSAKGTRDLGWVYRVVGP